MTRRPSHGSMSHARAEAVEALRNAAAEVTVADAEHLLRTRRVVLGPMSDEAQRLLVEEVDWNESIRATRDGVAEWLLAQADRLTVPRVVQ